MMAHRQIIRLRKFKELEIAVPWGKVAGKFWGPAPAECKTLIALLHGWQDNAASFDQLVNHLLPSVNTISKDLGIFALDFPGHGYSSWIPKGMTYNTLLCMQVLQIVREHFELEKIGLIGHSMGGMMSFQYAQLFPECVQFIVALDNYKHNTFNEDRYYQEFHKQWNTFFKLQTGGAEVPSPRYSKDELVAKLMSIGSLQDRGECELLLARGSVIHPDDGTMSLTRDPAVCLFLISDTYSEEHLKIQARRIKCPFMLIKAKDNYFEKKSNYYSVLKELGSFKDFQFHEVPNSTHHFHINNAPVVAQLINPFLRKYIV